MPYYRRRKKLREEKYVFFAFSFLAIGLGSIVGLLLLSVGLLSIGMLLTKIFPVLTLFQATMVPLVLAVFIGLYLAIGLSAADIKSARAPADPEEIDPSAESDESESWRYRQGPMGL